MILVVAEKPSVARVIASVLGANDKKDGYMEGNGYIVSWCIGHMADVAPSKEYADFNNTLPFIPQVWKFVVLPDTKSQFAVLKNLEKRADISEVICATDAGREGECIFRYIFIELLKSSKYKRRLWIASLEESAVKAGFANLKNASDFDKLYASGLSRRKADWLIGMNGSQLFSRLYQTKLSVGRVQTPTLALIVQRDFNVKNFVKEQYFTVDLHCPNENGKFIAISEKIADEHGAIRIKSECYGRSAIVTKVTKEVKTVSPPKLFDLTTLQREANRLFSFSAQQTLDITQELYEKKLVTYPRTDSQFLTEDMEESTRFIVEGLTSQIPFLSGGSQAVDIKRVINNKKVSDHHAIIPTKELLKLDLASLSEEHRRIALLIATKLVCAVGIKHEFEAVTATVNCNSHLFTAKGKKILCDGWRVTENAFKTYIKCSEDDESGTEKENQELNVSEGLLIEIPSPEISQHWTSPPKHYTDDTLLSAMETAGNSDYIEGSDVEKKGIGTPATRAGIIEKIITERGYIVRKGKQLLATEKGIKLIEVVPEVVKSAKLTADWETELQAIEKGNGSASKFMRKIAEFTEKFVKDNSSVSAENANEFVEPREKIVVGKCPKCGKDVTETPNAFSCCGGKKDDGSCDFVLWKKQRGKENALTITQAKKLLTSRKTDKIKGFPKKAGGTYSAFLVLKDDFTVDLEF
jgi:DNA topoisomerase-3